MCGVCGIFNYKKQEKLSGEVLADMTQALYHRGPDDYGVYLDNNVGLGHRRLSIIDLKKGHQPIHNETKRIWIVYNGEVYNYRELRKELKAKGHLFYTESDTEVILHLYEEEGFGCVDKLNGMFAFAIWDNNTRTLFIARDRLGIKPLYFTVQQGSLVFGSEIKAVLKHPDVKREFNEEVLEEFLTFHYPLGDATMFKGIAQLLPGHILICKEQGEVRVERYWQVPFDKGVEEADNLYQRIYSLLDDSVRKRLISEVPLGLFLSGGIDSSSIAYFMNQASPGSVNSFSIGFKEKGYSEFEYTDIIVKRFNTRHTELRVEAKEFFHLLPKVIWHRDEPLVIPNEVALFVLSKKLKEFITVVLSGEGADELFGGYPKFLQLEYDRILANIYNLIPGFFKSRIFDRLVELAKKGKNFQYRSSLVNDHIQFYIAAVSCVAPLLRKEICKNSRHRVSDRVYNEIKAILPGDKNLSFIDLQLLLDAKLHLPMLLSRLDRMTMAASVEARVPFLDHRLFEYVSVLPTRYKIKGFRLKYILKEIMKDKLPQRTVYRKKMGFPVPLQEWFHGELRDYTKEVLLSAEFKKRGYFNFEAVEKMVKLHTSGEKFFPTPIWILLNLEIWHRVFIDPAEI